MIRLYHGTASNHVNSIMARGLVPRAGRGADSHDGGNIAHDWRMFPDRANSVFLTPDIGTARMFAVYAANANRDVPGTVPAVVEVQLPDTAIRELKADEAWSNIFGGEAYRHVGPIPPSTIAGIVA